MTLAERIAEHALTLDPATYAGRPPAPLTDDPSAADSVAYAEWCATAPRRLNLMGEDLSSANLRDADLRLAGLRGCDLHGADLQGCDLRGADLRDCKLAGADLTGATIDASTRIQGIDVGSGLANRTSLALLLEAIGGDPEEAQTRALIEAIQSTLGS